MPLDRRTYIPGVCARDTKGFARAGNLFRKYWCNFLGQQHVIIRGVVGGRREGKKSGMRKEIDIKRVKRSEKEVWDATPGREKREREREKGGKC